MSVATHKTPQTSNQNIARIPTQTSPKKFDTDFMRHHIDAYEPPRELVVIQVRSRYEKEKNDFPGSISMLREVFVQTGINRPQDIETVTENLDTFTQRALLAHALYSDQIADAQSPTGKNRVKYEEILDLIEQLQIPFMQAMDALTKDEWVKSHPVNVKPEATEAYAIACIMTLDENHITPGFMIEPHEEIHE